MKQFSFVLLILIPWMSMGFAQTRSIQINDVFLSDEDVFALESFYQVHISDGQYWYDPVSGLVGTLGGPSVGQIMAGLPLGTLNPDASYGGTGIFVNGREIHRLELQDLQALLGVVYPGHYWMDAYGNVGSESAGYLFNLFALAEQTQGSALRADGRSLFGHSLTGSVIGKGDTVGFIDGDIGITCGPDGGCTGW